VQHFNRSDLAKPKLFEKRERFRCRHQATITEWPRR
jgi:hypothetical protein